jgi:hypothetical protein
VLDIEAAPCSFSKKATSFDYGLEELARRFDRSVSWVSRRLALVEVLPEAIQQQVREGQILAQVALKFLVPVARQNLELLQTLLFRSTPSRPRTGVVMRNPLRIRALIKALSGPVTPLFRPVLVSRLLASKYLTMCGLGRIWQPRISSVDSDTQSLYALCKIVTAGERESTESKRTFARRSEGVSIHLTPTELKEQNHEQVQFHYVCRRAGFLCGRSSGSSDIP